MAKKCKCVNEFIMMFTFMGYRQFIFYYFFWCCPLYSRDRTIFLSAILYTNWSGRIVFDQGCGSGSESRCNSNFGSGSGYGCVLINRSLKERER